MASHYALKNNAFVIENYNQARPFASFLPGISGLYGKPMWVFYANRGQCIASFGVKNKNGAMLEFYPANKAYTLTPLLGFRTFLRYKKGAAWQLYEPFQVNAGSDCRQILRVRAEEIEIEETNKGLGVRTTVVFFNAPNEKLPVLVRQVRIENIGNKLFKGELIDGLPQVVPFGLNEYLLKQMSRTMEAFAETVHAEEQLPFFKLKTEPSDKPEVTWIEGGFFAFSFSNGKSLPVKIDPATLFGADTSFQSPQVFAAGKPITRAPERSESRFGCAFSYAAITVAPRKDVQVDSYFGQAENWNEARDFRSSVEANSAYATSKRKENSAVVAAVTDAFAVRSSSAELDAYSKQSYLDNVLRGGQPIVTSNGESTQVFHVYSRKHGDMERDYNFFELSPTYFSQGNGNFRDVNQNRRSETFLHAGLGAGNIETFFNLIQLDGYNPLVIQYEKFHVGGKFVRPGDLFEKLLQTTGSLDRARSEFERAVAGAHKVQDASHGEGFWVDHWTYNLDLLESFAAVYPDQMKALFVDRHDFTFYDNDHRVAPREKKYVLRHDGVVRQMHAVVKDPEKARLIRRRKEDAHKVRTKGGTGSIYQTTLLAKVLNLLAVKAATLDPFGMGLEMESEKPGWCDALNGLPGLLGSSMNEAFALKRWVIFIQSHLGEMLPAGSSIKVAEEIGELVKSVKDALALAHQEDFFRTWDTLASLRERFRQKTWMGVTGEETALSHEEISAFLSQVVSVLSQGLARARQSDGLYTTYFINHVSKYEKLPAHASAEDPDAAPVQHVRALGFKQEALGAFLESQMNALRQVNDEKEARDVYTSVKNSALHDKKLGMYKLNVPLVKESFEIGRNKIFTPGWLENESIFLHMHYKYLFEVLRSGLAEEFFAEMKTGIVPFMDPKVYGRSTLENSSFIASSSFPDASLHGSGFVARLSGSTAEWISIVFHLALGTRPFTQTRDGLRFEPQPTLPGWLFTTAESPGFKKATFSVKLFGQTWITYSNASRKNTYGSMAVVPRRYTLQYPNGREEVIEGSALPDAPARDLRLGKLSRLIVDLR